MDNPEHMEILKQGVEVWNQWREAYTEHTPILAGADLRGADLSLANLSNTILWHANLSGADLSGANLTNAGLSHADLTGAILHGSVLKSTGLGSANLRECDLSGANLESAHLSRANMRGANLSDSDLDHTDLSMAILRDVNFSNAKLIVTNLSGAELIGVDLSRKFSQAVLSGNINFSGANLSSAKLWECDLRWKNLSGAELSGAYLGGALLSRANLSRAHLRGAYLDKAHIEDADLTGADLTGADLRGTYLMRADLRDAVLTGANLEGAQLIESNIEGARLSNSRVYGISVWDVRGTPKDQTGLVITPDSEASITVDDLEVAQLIRLLLNYKKLRNVLDAVTRRGVLILGRFSGGGLEILQAIAARLRELDYLPILFDFDRPSDRNYTETIKTLAGLSRFIIADLTGPSVPQELYATVPHFKIPFVPIIESGQRAFAMAVDLLEYPWVVRPPVTFANKEDLLDMLQTRIVSPAEEKYAARRRLLDELFNQG